MLRVICSSRALFPYVFVCTFRDEERALLHVLLKLTILAFVPEDEGVRGISGVTDKG